MLDVSYKVLLSFIATLVLILFLLQLLILFPPVQNKLRNIAASTLHDQLKADVSIGQFRLGFPKKLNVRDVLISADQSDTLLYIGDFSVNIQLLPLFRNDIVFQRIELSNGKGDFGKLLDRLPADTTYVESDDVKDESDGWDIQINKLIINSCYFNYRDEINTGFDLVLDIKEAIFKFGTVDFDTIIEFSSIDIRGAYVSYESLFISEVADIDSTDFKFADIRVKKANLAHAEFAYFDSTGAILFNAQGDQVEVNDLLVDITHGKLVIDEGLLKNTTTSVGFLPVVDTITDNHSTLNWGPSLWRVEGNKLDMENFRLAIDYQEAPDPVGHFNSEHIDFNQVTGRLSTFTIDQDSLTVKMEHISGKEKNGFVVNQLDGEFYHEGKDFVVRDLKLKTTNALYRADLRTNISPTNYDDLNGKTFDLDLVIESETMRDINYFYPIMAEELGLADDFLNNNFSVKTKINGSMDELNIQQFNLDYLSSTAIYANGLIKNMNSSDSMLIDMDIEKINIAKKDLEGSLIIPLPDSLTLPEYITLRGHYTIRDKTNHFNSHIQSSIGDLNNINATALFGKVPLYKLEMDASLHDLQSVLDMNVSGVDFRLKASWEGNDLYSSEAFANFFVDSLAYAGNVYQNVGCEASLDRGIFHTNLQSHDTSVYFTISANGELTEQQTQVELFIDADKIDLNHLGLYPTGLNIKSNSDVSLNYYSSTEFAMSANLRSLDFILPDTFYTMHPINLDFNTKKDFADFHLNSFFYNLDFTSNANIQDFLYSIFHLPGYYLSEPGADSVRFDVPEFNLRGKLEFPEAFAKIFFPEFPAFQELVLEGSFSEARDELLFNASIPGLSYGTLITDNLMFSIDGTSERLTYNGAFDLNIQKMLQGNFDLSGTFQDSELISRIKYMDSFSNPYLDFTVHLDTIGNSVLLNVLNDSLIFSYDPWEISSENQVKINSENLVFNNFNLSSKGQQITIFSDLKENPEGIHLTLKDFKLGSLEQLLARDTLVSGTANANVHLNNLFGQPDMNGSLTIDNLNLLDFDIGRLNLSEFIMDDEGMMADLSLIGSYEDIRLRGAWIPANNERSIDIDLTIAHLDLGELDYILSDYIRDAKGSLQGNMKITGTLEEPFMNGLVSFKEAGFGVIALNNYFTVGDDPITFNDNEVRFNNFSFRNVNDQEAKIIGEISLGHKGDVYHNLQIMTDNMVIMNSTREINDIVYGLLKAKTDIEIVGQSENIKVNATVNVDKSTDITYIFPETLTLDNNEGTVVFTRFQPDALPDADINGNNAFFGMQMLSNFNSQVIIDRGTRFNLFFDSSGENFLNASIKGDVNYKMVEINTEVSGMFEIESGTLHYSIPMVTVEEYKIEPGSRITLSNDLYNPYVNIIASSEIRASTEGLMAGNAKVMTFKVLLFMEGELNDVQLRFDISTQTNDVLVSTRLEQLTEEERNINALNLLVRGSFMITLHGDEIGSTTSAEARLDNFYATHLNHLISDNISFVDLKFDVQSFKDYNSSGDQVLQRNYYYNIGKSFLHDRARINYKGSLGVTSDLQAEQVNSHFVQNELELEMKITNDGRYRGLIFRKNQYEGLLEGEVIETGGGIRFSQDFYSFGDIFINNKRQLKRETRKLQNTKDQ